VSAREGRSSEGDHDTDRSCEEQREHDSFPSAQQAAAPAGASLLDAPATTSAAAGSSHQSPKERVAQQADEDGGGEVRAKQVYPRAA
jgi:hypothetical protein